MKLLASQIKIYIYRNNGKFWRMTGVYCLTVLFSVLQAEDEFRDKLSPIFISLNFSLDPRATVAQTGLRPVLNYQTEQLIEQKVCVVLKKIKKTNQEKTVHGTVIDLACNIYFLMLQLSFFLMIILIYYTWPNYSHCYNCSTIIFLLVTNTALVWMTCPTETWKTAGCHRKYVVQNMLWMFNTNNTNNTNFTLIIPLGGSASEITNLQVTNFIKLVLLIQVNKSAHDQHR